MKTPDWITEEEARAAIRFNVEAYMESWLKYPNTIFKGWNWGGLSGFLWPLCRKVHSIGTSYLAFLYIMLRVVMPQLAISSQVWNILTISLFVGVPILLSGLFGNALYERKIKRLVCRARKFSVDKEEQLDYLRRRGGITLLWGYGW